MQGAPPRTQRHNGPVSPALLTSYIKKAWAVKTLFHTYSTHKSSFNHIHLSACWNSLGHLARGADSGWHQEHATALAMLVEQTTAMVKTDSHIRVRELANIAHGVAKSGRGSSMGSLMEALARSIEWRLHDCNPQELANVAWAFAKAGQSDPALFTALATVAERCLPKFNAQEHANTAWAFATNGRTEEQLFTAMARVIEHRLGEFSTQGLANTAWAFAKAGHVDAQLFMTMSQRVQQIMDDFNAQDLANIAWAFAKLGHFDPKLFAALAKSAQWHNFNAQGLANAVWAFAKSGHLDAELFAALAKFIEGRLGDFNAQDLANASWAFAKACHLDEALFTAFARSAERCLDDFNSQDLVNTAWAFAKVGHFDDALFPAVAQSIIGRSLDELSAAHIANIAWAFAKAGQLDEQLLITLSRSAEQRVGDFSAHDLASTAWAFANAGQVDAQLFVALAKATEPLLDDFNEEDLDNAVWAFSKAGQQSIVQRLRKRKKHSSDAAASAALSRSVVDVSKCGRIIVAGGGIGGAAIAVALQLRGFDVIVLEADACFDARKQGYGLTIQRQDATRAMGINLASDDAPSTSHYTFSAEGEILGFFGEAFSNQGKERKEGENSGRFVHIPRQALRARIVELVRPGTIRWNSKLKDFACWCDAAGSRDQTNGVTVTLTDGTTLDAALLVGSDGIFSTVRRQLKLPGDRLNYVGLVVVLGIVSTISRDDQTFDGDEGNAGRVVVGDEALAVPLTHRRIFETVDGATRIYAMPFTTSSTMWQLSFPYAEDAALTLVKDPAALKAEILRRCGAWHEPVPDLLRATPLDCMSGYPVYDRELLEPGMLRPPVPQAKATKQAAATQPQRRVTLLGDAAHPMTPFKAQGANQALSDAVLLADCLADSVQMHGPHAGFDAALPSFERRMLNRSARMVVGSREKAKELHSAFAMQPARKVQRETGVDMQKAIRALRAKQIGAHSAADPRGLDAVVVAAIDGASSAQCSSRPKVAAKAGGSHDEKKRRQGQEPTTATGPKKQRQGSARLWGYVGEDWHKCVLVSTKKSGKLRVEWEDGTLSVLDADCTQPRSTE